MDNENILDHHFIGSENQLTDFQLAGILTEQNRYPSKILDRINLEVEKRNLSAIKIEQLKSEYKTFHTREKNESLNLDYIGLVIFVLLSFLFSGVFWVIPIVLSILLASLIAIKQKFKFGKSQEESIWKIFGFIYLFLIFLTLGVLILI